MKEMHDVMQLSVHIPFEATLCQLTHKKGGNNIMKMLNTRISMIAIVTHFLCNETSAVFFRKKMIRCTLKYRYKIVKLPVIMVIESRNEQHGRKIRKVLSLCIGI